MKSLLRVLIPLCLVPLSGFADKVKLLEGNQEALQARIDLITSAKREIVIEYFDVGNDKVALTGLGFLREAADRGVDVKILIDSINNNLSPAHLAAITHESTSKNPNKKQIQVKIFNPLFHALLNLPYMTYRNHDKLLAVDGSNPAEAMMVIGGRNAAKNYFGHGNEFNFLDADSLIVGHAASAAHEYFMKLWSKNPDVANLDLWDYDAGKLNGFRCNTEYHDCIRRDNLIREDIDKARGEMEALVAQFKAGAFDTKIQALSNMLADVEDLEEFAPGEKDPEMSQVFFAFNDPTVAMKKVQNKLGDQIMKQFSDPRTQKILIVTPYLFPTEEELSTLEKIIRDRKVEVTIVTNSLASNDMVLAHAGFVTIKDRLVKMGVSIYLFKPFDDNIDPEQKSPPEVLHCKGAIINDKISLIGSFNFDQRSAKINREIGVQIGSQKNPKVPRFTREFAAYIQARVLSRSVLIARDGILDADAERRVDALASERKIEELARKLGLVPLIGKHI